MEQTNDKGDRIVSGWWCVRPSGTIADMSKPVTPPAGSAWAAQVSEQRERHDELARASMIGATTAKTRAIQAEPSPPITLKTLAERLKMDRSACRRYILRMGIRPAKARTADSGYQLALVVTAAEARALQVGRAKEGYCDMP